MEQPTTTRPKPKPGLEILLRHSIFLLSQRDFTRSGKYALLVRESDPNIPGPDQIIAVANVLLAAERRFNNNNNNNQHLDLYSILQISEPGPETRPDIQAQFEKLSSLLNPVKNNNNNNNNVPFAEEAFKLVCDAWLVLSDPHKKTQYDNQIKNVNVNVNANGCVPQKAEKTEGSSNGNDDESGTFWTVCPYCYYMYEYERKYLECALRCQNCRRAFHGVEVPKPKPMEGKRKRKRKRKGKEEFYYGGFGLFPLGYRLDGDCLGDKKAKRGRGGGGCDNVVEISDDSDEEEEGMNVENIKGCVDGGEEKNVEVEVKEVKGGGSERSEGNLQGSGKVEVRIDGKRVMKKFKSVARKSKKIMGKGVRSKRIDESRDGPRLGGMELSVEFGNGSGIGNWDGRFEDEVEFF